MVSSLKIDDGRAVTPTIPEANHVLQSMDSQDELVPKARARPDGLSVHAVEREGLSPTPTRLRFGNDDEEWV